MSATHSIWYRTITGTDGRGARCCRPSRAAAVCTSRRIRLSLDRDSRCGDGSMCAVRNKFQTSDAPLVDLHAGSSSCVPSGIAPAVPNPAEVGVFRKIPRSQDLKSPGLGGPMRCPAPEGIHHDVPHVPARQCRVPGLVLKPVLRLEAQSPHAHGNSGFSGRREAGVLLGDLASCIRPAYRECLWFRR